MPQCVLKSCKNNARKRNLTAGVSYFRFPSNPFTCAEWMSIVARERGGDFYGPAKNSVICSDHFDKSDISGNTNRRRLLKTAVPKLQILPPSEDPQLEAPDFKLSVSDIEVQVHRYSEEPSTSAIPKIAYSDTSEIEEEPTETILPHDVEAPVKEDLFVQKLLSRKITDLKAKLIETRLIVKRVRRLNNSLRNRVNSLTDLLKKFKKRGMVTREDIQVERLKASNNQLKGKVATLRRLLIEEKKKNKAEQKNMVWCPTSDATTESFSYNVQIKKEEKESEEEQTADEDMTS